ncbi:MAG: hypothetical protein HOC71_03670 [Candidatus Latescibacteria bacterium]|jgi:aryl-alcohol dehydrogenase-like predicted oxidoreductase|nr:hypothetical protein [Candidatus Latescibacterota bacterium]
MKRRKFLETAAFAGATASIYPMGCEHSGGMIYRTLGKSGIKVSLLGFGSHLSKENKSNSKERDRQIKEGLDRGINFFDIYEHGYEQFEPMAKSLASHNNDVVISLVTIASRNNIHYRFKNIHEEVEGALKIFKRDHIDCYRVVNKVDRDADVLFRFKEQGKVRAVGIVAHYEEDAIKALEERDFDFVMLPYNFHHNWGGASALGTTYDLLMPLLKKNNIGIIAMKPMGSVDMIKLARDNNIIGPNAHGIPVPPAMLRYIFENPYIATAIPTMNSVDEVQMNYTAVERPALDDADRDVLVTLSKIAFETKSAYLSPHYQFLERWTV